jgi:hypothetical protein
VTVTRLARTSLKHLLEEDPRDSQSSEDGHSSEGSDAAPDVLVQPAADKKSEPPTPSSYGLPLPPQPGTIEPNGGAKTVLEGSVSVQQDPGTAPSQSASANPAGQIANRGPAATAVASKATALRERFAKQPFFGGSSFRSEVELATKETNNPFERSALSDPFLYTESNTIHRTSAMSPLGDGEDLGNRKWTPGQSRDRRRYGMFQIGSSDATSDIACMPSFTVTLPPHQLLPSVVSSNFEQRRSRYTRTVWAAMLMVHTKPVQLFSQTGW